jgi:hypothetical protein
MHKGILKEVLPDLDCGVWASKHLNSIRAFVTLEYGHSVVALSIEVSSLLLLDALHKRKWL